MDAKEYSDAVKNIQDWCHALAMRKYHQYARDGDAFFSIREEAKRDGRTAEEVMRSRMTKKDISIENMSPGEKRTSEIQDKIVYLIMQIIYEGNGKSVGLQDEMSTRRVVCG